MKLTSSAVGLCGPTDRQTLARSLARTSLGPQLMRGRYPAVFFREGQLKPRIMYIENKSGGLEGPARIGRVSFSKTGRSLYYRGKTFRSLRGSGFKSNYYDVETKEEYWISGPHKDGNDRLYGGSLGVAIDDDVREEYWRMIREVPDPEPPPQPRSKTAPAL